MKDPTGSIERISPRKTSEKPIKFKYNAKHDKDTARERANNIINKNTNLILSRTLSTRMTLLGVCYV